MQGQLSPYYVYYTTSLTCVHLKTDMTLLVQGMLVGVGVRISSNIYPVDSFGAPNVYICIIIVCIVLYTLHSYMSRLTNKAKE